MTGSSRLGDDVGEFLDLRLGASEGTKSLLCELAGTLVLGVTEEFDDTALVWCESRNLLHDLPNELGALASLSLGSADTRLDNACLCFLYSRKKR